MKIAADFKAVFRQQIDAMNARGLRRRPVQLNIDEAIDCLLKLVRTARNTAKVCVVFYTLQAREPVGSRRSYACHI